MHKYIYTDEHLKWDKQPTVVCILIDLSVTVALSYYKCSRVYTRIGYGPNEDL